MQQFEQYWLFAVFCVVVGVVLVRLVLREHITLQSSLWFFSFLGVAAVLAVAPDLTVAAARVMGFTLPSNFFFALGIGGLALLHVHTLVMLSRAELRSIALTQELALLREQVERQRTAADSPPTQSGARSSVDSAPVDSAPVDSAPVDSTPVGSGQ
jgi:hypothetical protein